MRPAPTTAGFRDVAAASDHIVDLRERKENLESDADEARAVLAERRQYLDSADTIATFAEWKQLVKRRFGERDPVVYSQGTGRAAALVPQGDETLGVVAVLGMRWRPGKVVSARSLRGLRPLRGGA